MTDNSAELKKMSPIRKTSWDVLVWMEPGSVPRADSLKCGMGPSASHKATVCSRVFLLEGVSLSLQP